MSEDETEHKAGVSPERLQAFFAARVERIERRKSIMAGAMAECKEQREADKRDLKMLIAEGADEDGLRLEIKIHDIKYGASIQIQNALDDEDDEVLESAQAVREAIGEDLATLGLFASAISRAEKNEAEVAARKVAKADKAAKRSAKKGAKVDTGAAAKADALKVGDEDEPDLRGARQKEREELRKAEAAERLKGIKPLPDQPMTH